MAVLRLVTARASGETDRAKAIRAETIRLIKDNRSHEMESAQHIAPNVVFVFEDESRDTHLELRPGTWEEVDCLLQAGTLTLE